MAHATALGSASLIPQADADALVAELRRLGAELADDGWTVNAEDEDVHSKIEALLIEPADPAPVRSAAARCATADPQPGQTG